MRDAGQLDAVEQLIPLAQQAGLSLAHMAVAFVMAHPGVTSAIIGPRTMEQLDDYLAGAEVVLDDGLMDEIDRIAPPGGDIGPNDANYVAPSLKDAKARRREPALRRAA
jgi:aryl-alcohol dehydrogenase (NADP+)